VCCRGRPLGGGKLTRPWGTRTDRSTTDRYNKSMYDADEDATKGSSRR
jgi:hypothetical protein